MYLDLSMLPFEMVVLISGGFGVIIGSFLNVLIYRFHTGKSLMGSSHCLSCGVFLKAYDLIPVVSYVALRGRCRQCGSSITLRYFYVELLTGVLFALVPFLTLHSIGILYWWLVMAILIVVVVYDIRHYIIPDSLTGILTVLMLGKLTYEYSAGTSFEIIYTDVIASLAGVGFFYLLWLLTKGRGLGFGDVKLAFPLGLMVGSSLVASMVVLSFWIGALISLLLIGIARLLRGKLWLPFGLPRLTIKSVVPFAPFMVAAAIVVLFSQSNVLYLFTFW